MYRSYTLLLKDFFHITIIYSCIFTLHLKYCVLCVSDGKVHYVGGDKSKAPRLCVTTEDEVLDILKQNHTIPLGGAKNRDK